MLKFVLTSLLMLLTSSSFAVTAATSSLSPEQQAVVKFVNRAISYVKKNSKVKAAVAFNQKKNKAFWQPPLYIFAFTCGVPGSTGFVVADPATPNLLFKNKMSNPIVAKLIAAAYKAPNGSWVTYKWMNPASNKVTNKHSYVVYLSDYKLCLGSGYYE